MPTTRKEGLYFGSMMCFGMVVIMTIYNMYMNDLFGILSFKEIVIQFVLAYVIALVLDLFFVGPLASKIVSLLPFSKKNIPLFVISMSTCMVFGMAFCMSFYGLVTSYLHSGVQNGTLYKDYLHIFTFNFIFALPLQLVVMGPIIRLLFIKFIKKNTQSLTAN
ncbi:hypothetical protein SAMN05216353_1368 [Halobacillus alkaliphilus]|uniref:DUF2798 domain-containing protein n=1 Tax=Halobacillus alkaliphilus TaxID=396056 RepID=A0A1I2QZ16_9BACI|nr:DUF2798 domain-containing protein [Halobacillus alkaliphilus]SFG33735.1 hypothetical protein SAMN05216353_1368 [Halobacillus alkaliphilus]